MTSKAQQVSEQIATETHQTLEGQSFDSLRINNAVDIYVSNEPEILLFDDGIQVKGQREHRRKKNQQQDIRAWEVGEETKSALSQYRCHSSGESIRDIRAYYRSVSV